jgi:hypothetical protein
MIQKQVKKTKHSKSPYIWRPLNLEWDYINFEWEYLNLEWETKNPN